MKVFISWSKERARAVAIALRDWLPNIIQSLDPWMSDKDIPAGADWFAEIMKRLDEADVGLLVVTPENQREPWLLFEAGALAKRFGSRVIPILYNLETADLIPPLAFRNVVKCDREGFRRIVLSINETRGDKRLNEVALERSFQKWFPDLEESLKNIPKPASRALPTRSLDEKIDEILDAVRGVRARGDWTDLFIGGPLQTTQILSADVNPEHLFVEPGGQVVYYTSAKGNSPRKLRYATPLVTSVPDTGKDGGPEEKGQTQEPPRDRPQEPPGEAVVLRPKK